MSKISKHPNIFKEFLITVCISLLTIPFTIIVWLILLLGILPCYLYRSFVAFLAHKLDPDMGKLITGMSAGQNRDFDVLHEKPYCSQVVCFRVTGRSNMTKFRETFSQRIIQKLDPTLPYTPTLQYPELQQYLTRFMGYSFLKKDRKFDIKNHFTYLPRPANQPLGRKELSKIWEEQTITPFPKGRSPWHFTIIDNYIPDQKEMDCWVKTAEGYNPKEPIWIALFRIHHSLADGFAIQKMLSYLSDEPYVPKFSSKTTDFQRFLMHLRTGVLGTYDGLTRILRYIDGWHTFHQPARKHTNECFIVESDHISMKKVKLIKQKYNTAFTAALVAAISGGLRKFLLRHKRPIPDFISTAIPFTDPDHTAKFDNRFSLAAVGLGVHLDNPKDRILYVKSQFKLLLGSSWINVLDIAINCLACFPSRMLRFVSQRSVFSSCYSTQPGPDKCLQAFDGILLEVNFSFGTGSDSLGFGLSSITFNQRFRFVLFIDKFLVEGDKEQAEELMSLISEEFDALEAYENKKAAGVEIACECGGGDDDEKARKWKESIKYD